ncbi:MAG: helix-turn-helix domain-containing protein, partial [Bacteroidia bacterium]
MLDRIKEIMQQKGLSPMAFADAISVQRSSISHILNGRNKPSLELVQKIISAFPDIDIEWLLTGQVSDKI